MSLLKRKTIVSVFAVALLAMVLALAGCSSSSSSSSSKSTSSSSSTAQSSTSASASSATASSANYTSTVDPSDPYGSGIHHAVLTVEGYAPVTIELNADAAPVSVANFAKLANEGYYNGLNFYRFVEGFCMQGGTAGNSASGADGKLTPIIGEFSTNGVDNPLADNFQKGTVAMARTTAPNSATSTFFITLDTNSGVSQSLDGQYAAFGTIDANGMAVIDQIVADCLPNVTDPAMGSIDTEEDQAKITSIEIID